MSTKRSSLPQSSRPRSLNMAGNCSSESRLESWLRNKSGASKNPLKFHLFRRPVRINLPFSSLPLDTSLFTMGIRSALPFPDLRMALEKVLCLVENEQ